MTWRPQTTFKNGEVSPRLDGMADMNVYEASCRKLEGGIVSSDGTVQKRNGTYYVGNTVFNVPSSVNTDTYTSLACKLIPYQNKNDIFALVFEVIQDSNGAKFSVIRAVVNNVLQQVVGVTTAGGKGGFKLLAKSNLPFKAHGTLYTSTSELKNYLPPGTTNSNTNNFTTAFGLHNFTAEQVPELEYFQHQDKLIVMHPDNYPIEVFVEKGSISTRMYECSGRSPQVDRRGDTMTMSVTSTSNTGDSNVDWTDRGILETTKDYFSNEDFGNIYRIGHITYSLEATDYEAPDHGQKVESQMGLYVKIDKVENPRKARYATIHNINMDGGSGDFPRLDTVIEDPEDWEGPFVESGLQMSFTASARTDLSNGDTANDHRFFTSRLTSVTIPSGMTAHQLVGCIVVEPFNSSKDYFYQIAEVNSGTSTTNPTSSIELNAFSINNLTTQTATNAKIYRLRDRKTDKLKPVLTMKNLIDGTTINSDGFAARSEKAMFTVLKGQVVNIYVGNVDADDLKDVVPEGHETFFDTYNRGDVTDPASEVQIGGILYLNGGTFAVTARGDNMITAKCITSPRYTVPTSKYSLGWSHAVGFPSAGTSHQGRVFFGGFKNAKQVVVGSYVDEPDRWDLGGTAPDGIHFIVNDLRGSQVRFMKSAEDLIIGTDSGEFSVKGSPLSAISAGVDRQSSYGSASIRPVMVGTFILFVQKDKKTVRAMQYIDQRQRYTSANVSSAHEHFFRDATIEEMVVWETSEDPVVIFRLSSGEYLGVRVNENAGFFGWSKLKLPTGASLCPTRNYLANASGDRTTGDDFYIAVDAGDYYELHRYDNTVFLDQAVDINISASSATSLVFPDAIFRAADNSALSAEIEHLDGETVSVVLDGVYKGEFTVAAGSPSTVDISSLSLSSTPTTAVVGKKIEMKVQPRVPEVIVPPGSTLGKVKNYSSVIVNLNNSKAVQVNGYEADGSTFNPAATSHPQLQGWYEVPVAGLYGIQPELEISSDRPYPVEIAGITIDVSVEG